MHKFVHTEAEHQEFSNKWGDIADINQFDNNIATGNEERVLIQNKEEKTIGTVELSKYLENSGIEKYFAFSKCERIQSLNPTDIYVISKLYIDEEHRGAFYFLDILKIIADHQKRTGAKYYTAQMQEYLYLMLTNLGMEIEALDEPKPTPIKPSVPIFLDMERVMDHPIVKRAFGRKLEKV